MNFALRILVARDQIGSREDDFLPVVFGTSRVFRQVLDVNIRLFNRVLDWDRFRTLVIVFHVELTSIRIPMSMA